MQLSVLGRGVAQRLLIILVSLLKKKKKSLYFPVVPHQTLYLSKHESVLFFPLVRASPVGKLQALPAHFVVELMSLGKKHCGIFILC